MTAFGDSVGKVAVAVFVAALVASWCLDPPAVVAGWDEQAKLVPGDGAADDWFGSSVSISGPIAIVGADETDDRGINSGAAYIFQNTGSTWTKLIKLLAHDGARDDHFGYSVAISGNTAIIGAYGDDDNDDESGSAYIFQNSGSGWAELAKLLPASGEMYDYFGWSVAIDGNTAVIGAPFDDHPSGAYSGAAYVFEDAGSGWTEIVKLMPDDGEEEDFFGASVSVSGNTVVVGSYADDDKGDESGSAYVFRNEGSGWTQIAKLLADDGAANDNFGWSVSLSGNTVVVGADENDDNGEGSGSAYVFQDSGSEWTQLAKLLPNDGDVEDHFGYSVSLDGQTAVVGAYGDADHGENTGSAYIFQHGGSEWTQADKLVHGNAESGDLFGTSVAIDDDNAVIGAIGDDDTGGIYSGAAYVFSPLIPGDANWDGMVTDADAAILATNWQMQQGATWGDGDFSGDGKVTDADAAILATHWQEGVEGSPAPVPEPAGLLLVASACLCLSLRRLQKRGV